MAAEKCNARSMRVWFVVMLGAIVALAGAPSIARAQTTGDDTAGDEGGSSPSAETEPAADSGPAAETEPAAEAAEPDAAAAAEERAEAAAEQREEATEETAEALASGDPEQAEEAAEETAEAVDDEAAAEQTQAAREPLPWRNSFFSWTHGVTPNTFFRDAQLSYNPNYYWWFSLTPRWYLDAQTFLWLSQGLFYELTDDDGSGSYNHDLQLTDTIIDLRRTEIWEGFIFIPALRVTLPASKASQAATRIFQLGAGLTAVRVIPEAASLTIALVGRYQYWFADRNVPVAMGDSPGQYALTSPNVPTLSPEGVLEAPAIDQASGTTSARHIVTAGLSLNITPIAGLNVSASAFWLSQEGHGLATGCTEVMTNPDGYECMGDMSATHWRHFTSLSLSIAYDVQPWLNLSIGWSNSTSLAPFFNPDGSVRGPFNPDNNFFLTATVQIDGLYETLTTGGEDDGLTPEQRQRRRQGLAYQPSSTGGAL